MAPKRPQYNPIAATSSSEEDEDISQEENIVVVEEDDATDAVDNQQSEDEDNGEGDGEEDVGETQKPTNNRANFFSDSESDADSDETPPSPNVSDFKIKPIASKPMTDLTKPKKIEPNPTADSPPPRTIVSGLKRITDYDLTGKQSSKRKKFSTKGGDDEDGKKSSGVPLLWSEDDEIALLKGMVDYQSKNVADVLADMGAFHEFIQKLLQVDVSKSKLGEKIKRLKKKFKTNVEKGEKREDPVFSKTHERKSFELSKKLWGDELDNNVGDSKKVKKARQPNSKPINEEDVKKNVILRDDMKADATKLSTKYPHLSEFLDSDINSGPIPESVKALIRERMNSLEATKAREFDAECKKLKIAELELFMRKADLVRELTKVTMDAI